MNKIIFFTFLFITSLSFTQEYDSTIQELEKQLESAISNENFQEATHLKKMRDLYVGLRKAVNNEDFGMADMYKKQIADLNQNNKEDFQSNDTGDCIVYIFSGKHVGPIGGYVNHSNGEKIDFKYGDLEKVILKSGNQEFITNESEIQYSIKRNLLANNIYFLEFDGKAGLYLERPTLRFVSQHIFDSITHFNFSIPNGFKVYSYQDQVKSKKLNLIFNKNCSDCKIQINGDNYMSSFKKKTIYTVDIAEEETFLTFIKPNIYPIKAPKALEHFSFFPKEDNFYFLIEIDNSRPAVGYEMPEIHFSELNSNTDLKKIKNKVTIIKK